MYSLAYHNLGRLGTWFLLRLFICLLTACVASSIFATRAISAEPSRAFVEGLRDRGMHEMALEYLKDLPKNSLAPKDFVRTSTYEEAATYIDWAGRTRDAKQQERRLAEGDAKLAKFRETNSTHPLASSALMQTGNIALHRARMKKLQATNKKLSEEDKAKLKAEAVTLFAAANKSFKEAEGKFKAARDKLPKTPKNRELRNTLRDGMLHSGVSAANSLYEQAKSQKDGSPEQKKTFEAASKVYEELFFKYQRYLLGLRYRLQQARCLQETNDKDHIETALMIYSEYDSMPDNDASIRELKLLAAAYQIAAMATPSIKKYDDAFKLGRTRMNKAVSSDKKSDSYQTLAMELALANEAALKTSKDPVKKRSYTGEAVRLARIVARSEGAQSIRAKQLLERLQGAPTGPRKEPTTHTGALSRGNEARGEWQAANESIKTAQEEKKPDAEEKFKQLAKKSSAEAMKYYNLAIRMADHKTTPEDIGKIRYILCYMYWVEGDFYRAATLGEYVTQMYPKAASAQNSAQLAMESYKRLYSTAEEGNRAFELERLTLLAEMIAERWPNDKSAETALLTLFNFKIRNAYAESDLAKATERFDQAVAILDRVDAKSPNAAVAEIQVGQGFWRLYLLSLQVPPEERIAQEQLEALADKAKLHLNKGVASSGEGEVNATVAKAALSLAKILVDDSELDKAVALLENKHHGPLTLVEAKHAAATDRYPIDTYKTALRAYVGSTPQRIDDAKKMLEKLKTAIGTDRKARERLDSELVNIGIRLKKQLDNEQRKEGHDAQVKALAKGIQVFLGEIGKANNKYTTLSWVASTFYNLGESFREAAENKKSGRTTAKKEAQQYFKESDKVYRRIYQTIKDDPEWGPKNTTSLDLRYANLLIRLKEFSSATQILSEILKKKPSMLSVQVEAAKAYQEWAEDYGKNDPKNMDKMFNRALAGYGRREDDKNKKIVWGWGQLRKLTYRDLERFGKYYHEASYNMATCLYAQSNSQLHKGSAAKKRADLAKQVIETAFKTDPKMGGSVMHRQYNTLLKSIQKKLGEPVVGLKKST